jgi:hypothetical protein
MDWEREKDAWKVDRLDEGTGPVGTLLGQFVPGMLRAGAFERILAAQNWGDLIR